MNTEITTMIELQHFWDNIMRCESEIERSNKSIKTWQERLKGIRDHTQKAEMDVKAIKSDLKKTELDLEDTEKKIEKTEQRKNQLKSEREIEAQNNELIRLNDSRDKLEEKVLEFFDVLENAEKKLSQMKEELEETDLQVSKDIEMINDKINVVRDESDEFRKKFSDMIESLSPAVRSRFTKLTGSKDGVAIAKLNGEICSHCNFQIPSSLAVSASAGKKIETCTNCGRFIY